MKKNVGAPVKYTGIRYYSVIPSEHHRMGERYFKVDDIKRKVVLVCVNSGEQKSGRPNMYGAYLISYSTFTTNYFMNKGLNLEEIPEQLFTEQYKKVINNLHICTQ